MDLKKEGKTSFYRHCSCWKWKISLVSWLDRVGWLRKQNTSLPEVVSLHPTKFNLSTRTRQKICVVRQSIKTSLFFMRLRLNLLFPDLNILRLKIISFIFSPMSWEAKWHSNHVSESVPLFRKSTKRQLMSRYECELCETWKNQDAGLEFKVSLLLEHACRTVSTYMSTYIYICMYVWKHFVLIPSLDWRLRVPHLQHLLTHREQKHTWGQTLTLHSHVTPLQLYFVCERFQELIHLGLRLLWTGWSIFKKVTDSEHCLFSSQPVRPPHSCCIRRQSVTHSWTLFTSYWVLRFH